MTTRNLLRWHFARRLSLNTLGGAKLDTKQREPRQHWPIPAFVHHVPPLAWLSRLAVSAAKVSIESSALSDKGTRGSRLTGRRLGRVMSPSTELWQFEIEPNRFLTALAAAVRDRDSVVITYQSADDPLSHDFLLFPQRVYEQNGRWYVTGWSAHRPTRVRLRRTSPRFRNSGLVRNFRLDRISAVTARPAPDWSVGGYFRHHLLQRGVLDAVVIVVIDAFMLAALVGTVVGLVIQFRSK